MKYLKVYNKFQNDRRLFEEVDNPKKADFVEDDVEKFLKTLEDIAKKPEGLKQQAFGSMTYQKDVETIQIALLLLGYELPRFGVDGLYGPETASAVEKFKQDNKDVQENPSGFVRFKKWLGSVFNEELELVEIDDMNYTNLTHVDNPTVRSDKVNKALLDDIALASQRAGVVAKIHFAHLSHPSRKKSTSKSRHRRQCAVDISSIDGFSGDTRNGQNPEFKLRGDKLVAELVKLGYSWRPGSEARESGIPKAILWQTKVGGNHFNHIHISNTEETSTNPGGTQNINREVGPPVVPPVVPQETEVDKMNPGSIVEPIYVAVMIEKLRNKELKSTDLQRFIDIKNEGSLNFTLLDLSNDQDVQTYAQICQKFIDNYPPNLLGITGVMMSNSAKKAFDTYGSYIPPELALAQLLQEGGISNGSQKSRPIRTKNPFNVGNTDSGENEHHNTVESGIDRYFNLVAKRYLTGGKTADDLLQNYVNVNGLRYAGKGYEIALSKIVPKANSIADQILGTTKVQAQRV